MTTPTSIEERIAALKERADGLQRQIDESSELILKLRNERTVLQEEMKKCKEQIDYLQNSAKVMLGETAGTIAERIQKNRTLIDDVYGREKKKYESRYEQASKDYYAAGNEGTRNNALDRLKDANANIVSVIKTQRILNRETKQFTKLEETLTALNRRMDELNGKILENQKQQDETLARMSTHNDEYKQVVFERRDLMKAQKAAASSGAGVRDIVTNLTATPDEARRRLAETTRHPQTGKSSEAAAVKADEPAKVKEKPAEDKTVTVVVEDNAGHKLKH